jgi:translation initiation factor 2B subunit (eIF-2B alpha/beta/delta family)
VDYSNIKLTLAPKAAAAAANIPSIPEDDEDSESENAPSTRQSISSPSKSIMMKRRLTLFSSGDLLNEYNEYKDNILTSIDELINELESISEVIKDQAVDHINDNDVILTANHSDQLEDFFVEASQAKSFHVIIAESAPSLK